MKNPKQIEKSYANNKSYYNIRSKYTNNIHLTFKTLVNNSYLKLLNHLDTYRKNVNHINMFKSLRHIIT